MTYKFEFGRSALIALAATASTAAAYVDACDSGAQHVRLDPAYYQTCGTLLFHIFSMVDAPTAFPSLIEQSAAARDIAESVQIGHRLQLSLLGYYPQSNMAGTGIGELNNFFTSAPFLFDRWTLDTKVNWNISQNLNVFGRYSILDFRMDSPTAFGPEIEGPGMSGSRVGSPGISDGKTNNYSLGANWVIRPTLIMDGNYGFVRQGTNAESTSMVGTGGLETLK